jgi:opacity protein-like surface antigen
MKKFATVLGIALLGALQAAPAQAQGVEIGIKGGVNSAKFGGKDASGEGIKLSNLTGYTVGGFLNFGLGSAITFQPELLYSVRGTKFNLTDADASNIDTSL